MRFTRHTIFILIVIIAAGLIAASALFWKDKRDDGNLPPAGEGTPVDVAGPKSGVKELKPPANLHDKDSDGIEDTKEEELGTSDLEFDTDGDGLSDNDEINYWKTDPTVVDSDGDGFSDAWEIISGYNPNGTGKLTD